MANLAVYGRRVSCTKQFKYVLILFVQALWLQWDIDQDIISRGLYEEKLLKVKFLDDPTVSEISETILPKENYQLFWRFLELFFEALAK